MREPLFSLDESEEQTPTIQEGTIVIGSDGRGVVCHGHPQIQDEPEKTILVQYEGQGYTTEEYPKDVSIVGTEIPTINHPNDCGAGKGAECCIFLTVAPGRGFVCARRESIRWGIIFNTSNMNAKRQPTLIFPECQSEAKREEATP